MKNEILNFCYELFITNERLENTIEGIEVGGGFEPPYAVLQTAA